MATCGLNHVGDDHPGDHALAAIAAELLELSPREAEALFMPTHEAAGDYRDVRPGRAAGERPRLAGVADRRAYLAGRLTRRVDPEAERQASRQRGASGSGLRQHTTRRRAWTRTG